MLYHNDNTLHSNYIIIMTHHTYPYRISTTKEAEYLHPAGVIRCGSRGWLKVARFQKPGIQRQ